MKVTKNLRRLSGDSLPYPSPGTVSIKRESEEGVADDEVRVSGIRMLISHNTSLMTTSL